MIFATAALPLRGLRTGITTSAPAAARRAARPSPRDSRSNLKTSASRVGNAAEPPVFAAKKSPTLCDISTDYYSRLERQRGPHPSEQMIASIAQGLHLSLDERDHLFRLAGHNPPARGSPAKVVDS